MPPENINCTEKGYTRDKYDCRVYHKCAKGWKTTYMCPENLHFDPKLDLCNWPEVARCPILSPFPETNDAQGKAIRGTNKEKNLFY